MLAQCSYIIASVSDSHVLNSCFYPK